MEERFKTFTGLITKISRNLTVLYRIEAFFSPGFFIRFKQLFKIIQLLFEIGSYNLTIFQWQQFFLQQGKESFCLFFFLYNMKETFLPVAEIRSFPI